VARMLRLVNVVSLLTVAGLSAASALPLAPDTCASLDQERHKLEASGVLDDARDSADEAKALAKDRLERVQRYVEVSSLILFRCQPVVAVTHSPMAGAISASAAAGTPAAQKLMAGKRKAPGN
jgi:hypothetical protein